MWRKLCHPQKGPLCRHIRTQREGLLAIVLSVAVNFIPSKIKVQTGSSQWHPLPALITSFSSPGNFVNWKSYKSWRWEKRTYVLLDESYTHTHTHTYTHTHTHTHIYIYIYIHNTLFFSNSLSYIYVRVCLCVYVKSGPSKYGFFDCDKFSVKTDIP